jgi:PAS domain S-box-containing protein
MKKTGKREIKSAKSAWLRPQGGGTPPDLVRKQAALLEELVTLLDVGRDAIIIRDMAGKIAFWNRGAEELFGLSKEEALGKEYGTLQGVTYPVSSDRIMRAIETAGWWEGEVIYQGRGPDPVYLGSRVCLQKDEKGNTIALMEILNNITARKSAEAALRASERHYRLITDSIPDLVGTVDLNMHFTFLSSNAERKVGYTSEELMRMDLSGIISPESFQRAKAVIAQQLAIDKAPCQDPNRTFTVEVEIRNKDGSTRVSEMKISFIRDERGEPVSLLGVGRDITERKNREKGLRENEAHYVSLLRNFNGIAFRLSVTSEILILEGMIEQITGYTKEDFIEGRADWQKMVLPEDQEALKDALTRARTAPNFSDDRDYRIRNRDQQVRWVHVHSHNICDEAGVPVYIEGTLYDITNHKKANEELLWLASFPELNPNPIIEAGLDGKIYYMSPAALRLFPDVEARSLKHPYLAGLRWVLDRIVNEKRPWFGREVDVDGVWYMQKIFAIENNTRLRIYGVDITETKLIAQRLRMLNQQLADIIDFLPDATFVIDRHKRVIAWNRALEEMTGTKKEDVIGKSDHEYALPFYSKRRPILIDLIFRSDKEIETRYSYIKRKNNSLVAEVFVPKLNHGKGMFVWVKVAPFYDEQGGIIGAIESIRDITEQKESEAILRQDREAFESLVKSKTEELLRVQKELVDSQHLSEIGALAATIAHELRNPLAAIRTAVYNIRRKTQETRLNSHLDNIDKKVLESDQIINNLLSYSRIKTPQLERVDIHALLDECIKAGADRFVKYSVTVRKKCTCGKGDFIRADPLHMKELFNNILNNAYEALDHKKGAIAIQADYVRGKDFTVSFADNGVGISPENMKRISSPFFTTKSKGTGLGLTVCYQLVSLHNGTIDIKSELGKGTTVTVTLPVGGV